MIDGWLLLEPQQCHQSAELLKVSDVYVVERQSKMPSRVV
jgi:hypothetical protein